MRYGIYTTNRELAERMISTIDAETRTINSMEIKAITKDGDLCCWVHPNNPLGGFRCDISYIDIDTCSIDIIREVIIPFNLNKNFRIISIGDDGYDLDMLIDRLAKIRLLKGNISNVIVYDCEYGWMKIIGFGTNSDSVLNLRCIQRT